ncbi:MAG: NADH-quinone oxidoreductase subunit N, partial [Sphingobium sp.]|nr:NADH-quinone oxidoreductase subunit N [Sphingobium sp.]
FLVFDAAVAANLTLLAALGIAGSVIGAYYYLRIIKTIYFDKPSGELAQGRSVLDFSIITVCAALIVLGYLLNAPLGTASAAAAASLF